MNILAKFLNSFDDYLVKRENRSIERYLSQAQNLSDLEYRQRLLDAKTNTSLF